MDDQRHLFEIPEDVAYFNCAYMSPQLKSVSEAGHAAVDRKAEPWTVTSDDLSNVVALRAPLGTSS